MVTEKRKACVRGTEGVMIRQVKRQRKLTGNRKINGTEGGDRGKKEGEGNGNKGK
jgi:hypothetical protein